MKSLASLSWSCVAVLVCAALSVVLPASTALQQEQKEEPVVSLVRSSKHPKEFAPSGRRRRLLCLGIFRDCDDEEEEEDEESSSSQTENSTSTTDDEEEDDNDGGGLLGNDGELCLGIFRDCNETNSDSNNNNATTTNDSDEEEDDGSSSGESGTDSADDDDCKNSKRGIFGGRPLFGECGIITEFLTDAFDNDDSGDGGATDGERNNNDDGPFGLGLLPEGGLLWKVWNRDGDNPLLEALTEIFDRNTQSFASSFLQDWSESATPTNGTCVNDATAPACFDARGKDGFWVCRTLTDPFTGVPDSKNLCIGEGSFLDGNDQCGCCAEAPTSSSNVSVTPAATCPASCPCQCDLQDSGDDASTGVLVVADLGDVIDLGDETTSDTTITRCVDARWAVSVTSSLDSIRCLSECPSVL